MWKSFHDWALEWLPCVCSGRENYAIWRLAQPSFGFFQRLSDIYLIYLQSWGHALSLQYMLFPSFDEVSQKWQAFLFVPNLGNRNPIPHNTDLVTFEHKMPKSCDLRLHSRNTERGDHRELWRCCLFRWRFFSHLPKLNICMSRWRRRPSITSTPSLRGRLTQITPAMMLSISRAFAAFHSTIKFPQDLKS